MWNYALEKIGFFSQNLDLPTLLTAICIFCQNWFPISRNNVSFNWDGSSSKHCKTYCLDFHLLDRCWWVLGWWWNSLFFYLILFWLLLVASTDFGFSVHNDGWNSVVYYDFHFDVIIVAVLYTNVLLATTYHKQIDIIGCIGLLWFICFVFLNFFLYIFAFTMFAKIPCVKNIWSCVFKMYFCV